MNLYITRNNKYSYKKRKYNNNSLNIDIGKFIIYNNYKRLSIENGWYYV